MKFETTRIEELTIIRADRRRDDRGWFTRNFCEDAFAEAGLKTEFPQLSSAFNHRKGTIRGLHYQRAPAAEAKIVRCLRGTVFDVVVDIRPGSESYGDWVAIELSDRTGDALYIPEGCAHGYQTLCDDTELLYQISVAYVAELSDGIRWNDPDLAIPWPIPKPILSDRDRNLPLLTARSRDKATAA